MAKIIKVNNKQTVNNDLRKRLHNCNKVAEQWDKDIKITTKQLHREFTK